MLAALKFIYLMALSVWMGSLVFFSFIAAPGIFKALSRESAGDVVGVIFPRYWAVGYVASVLCLASILWLSVTQKRFPASLLVVLAIMGAVSFYSGISVGGKARVVKAEMRAAESPEKKAELKAEFRKIHIKSSVLNMTVIILGVVAVFLTSTVLRF
jgi:uncharacterized membrane protein